MEPTYRPSALGALDEIAVVLSVPKARVARWIDRRASTGFPEPVLMLAAGNVYDLVAVRNWFDKWRATRRTNYKET